MNYVYCESKNIKNTFLNKHCFTTYVTFSSSFFLNEYIYIYILNIVSASKKKKKLDSCHKPSIVVCHLFFLVHLFYFIYLYVCIFFIFIFILFSHGFLSKIHDWLVQWEIVHNAAYLTRSELITQQIIAYIHHQRSRIIF